MFTIVLFEPEIPPNTGNIIRLCANTGAQLHLVKPLGFKLEDKQLKRAGLDYHEYASLVVHENWLDCKTALSNRRIFAITTKGSTRHSEVAFQAGDVFVFPLQRFSTAHDLGGGIDALGNVTQVLQYIG
jgi:tRNA (cytidine/uridine-2'-O-)-methyltransferase